MPLFPSSGSTSRPRCIDFSAHARIHGVGGSSRSPRLRPENIVHHTMSTSSASAPSASSKITHMSKSFPLAGRCVLSALILGSVSGCGILTGDVEVPAPAASAAAASQAAPASSSHAMAPTGIAAPATPPAMAHARWVPVTWADLPGWNDDRTLALWPALRRSCERPAPAWMRVCADARGNPPVDDAAARAWLQQRLAPFSIESTDGKVDGLATGYFEPEIDASRRAQGPFHVPLYTAPPQLATQKPYWTRYQVDTLSAAKAQLRGRELAFVADPLDALILQIQGSGRLRLVEPDGTRRLVRAAFAGHNEQPYKSVGRWLVEQGQMSAEQASWPAIKAWVRANPKRLNEMMWSNPRVVFFREEPVTDPAIGPRGAQGVPLTPGRSIAVDTASVPFGTPVWLDTTEPLSSTPLRRIAIAQDTGSAIVGAVRADYFWGWGEQAEQQAGRMKQPLRMWALWPSDAEAGKP